MSRPNLQLLPGLGEAEPYVSFCGHCAKRPTAEEAATRVCTNCHLGVIVAAPESLAPTPDEPFLIVDGKLQICAVSRKAEKILGSTETDVVNRQLTDVLLPADAEAAGIESLVSMVVHAARGDGSVHDLVVRPAGEWGIRWFTRVGPCGAPSAALIVLAPEG
jgi:PAS domain-containing protein